MNILNWKLMDLVYILWVNYYAFIKSVYTKRWKDMNSSVFALAVASLFVYLLFLIIAVEIIFDINGFLSLFQRGLPVGPISMGVSFVILIIMSAVLNTINIKNKFLIKRNTVARFKNKSKVNVKIYLIICLIVFFFVLAISVF